MQTKPIQVFPFDTCGDRLFVRVIIILDTRGRREAGHRVIRKAGVLQTISFLWGRFLSLDFFSILANNQAFGVRVAVSTFVRGLSTFSQRLPQILNLATNVPSSKRF